MPADFAILVFDETVGMVGQEETQVLSFKVGGAPKSGAYAQVRVHDLQQVEPPLELVVNDQAVAMDQFSPAGSDIYQTIFQVLPEGCLKKGENTLKVRRKFFEPESADSARVVDVVVHWRQ